MGNVEVNYQALMMAGKDGAFQPKPVNKYKSYRQDTRQGITGEPVGKLCDMTGQAGAPLDTGSIYVENCSQLDVRIVFSGTAPALNTPINVYEILDDETQLALGQGKISVALQFAVRVLVGPGISQACTAMVGGVNIPMSPPMQIPHIVGRRIGVGVTASPGTTVRVIVFGRE